MRVVRLLLWAAVGIAGGAATGNAQQSDQAARQLTVEVFSARKVAVLTLVPLGKSETVRLCAACRARAIAAPVVVKAHDDEVELGPQQRAHEVELNGAFRAKPDGGAEPIEAAGVWKVRVVHGALQALLTMDSEHYVELALEGEAGAMESPESLKAMAVVTRTYALENANRHRREGFDLCDSTHCQALQFGKPSPAIEQAVRETAGETLWFGARRATVFYAQNCGGQTEDAGVAWPGTGEPYLKAHADPYCTRHGAAEWHAEIPVGQLLQVARSEGWQLPARIEAVRVTKRTDAGRAVEVEFGGGGATADVAASSLHFAVDRALGWNRLRSDWYTVSLRSGVLHFDGRGFGHGVGLCQAGAAEMAAEGHSAAEILDFYFPGTRAGVTPEDHGWVATHEAGWTLRSVGPASAELAREGNAAWAKARELYPPRAALSSRPVAPEVWAMPTTELFRQETHQPGWMLASTQGTRVVLQPEAVVRRSGSEEPTLLHEFLHVLVESEAAAAAPLWVREGVVEALVQPGGPEIAVGDRAPMSGAELDAALARPASQAESQRAHAEAARQARALIAQFGLEQVRAWLRSGNVPDMEAKAR